MSLLTELFNELAPEVTTIREFSGQQEAIEHIVVSASDTRAVVTLGRPNFTFSQLVFDVLDGKLVLTTELNIDLKELSA